MLDLKPGACQFRPMTQRRPVDPHAILFKGVGTWDAIAVAVAGMAPTMAMNLNPQEPAEHVGRVVPLVFALSTVVVLMVAWCFARLAHHHPNAGSAYGFVRAELGPRAGLVAGWTLLPGSVWFWVASVLVALTSQLLPVVARLLVSPRRTQSLAVFWRTIRSAADLSVKKKPPNSGSPKLSIIRDAIRSASARHRPAVR